MILTPPCIALCSRSSGVRGTVGSAWTRLHGRTEWNRQPGSSHSSPFHLFSFAFFVSFLPSLHSLFWPRSLTFFHFSSPLLPFSQVTQDVYGAVVEKEIIPGGKDIPVTADNRIRFIHVLADFLLNVSLKAQARAMLNGIAVSLSSHLIVSSLMIAAHFSSHIASFCLCVSLRSLFRIASMFPLLLVLLFPFLLDVVVDGW